MATRSDRRTDLFACRDAVLDALIEQASKRKDTPDWEAHERFVMAKTANTWAAAHGYDRRVSVHDIEAVEGLATGHIDYAAKIALYVAEMVVYPMPLRTAGQSEAGQTREEPPSDRGE